MSRDSGRSPAKSSSKPHVVIQIRVVSKLQRIVRVASIHLTRKTYNCTFLKCDHISTSIERFQMNYDRDLQGRGGVTPKGRDSPTRRQTPHIDKDRLLCRLMSPTSGRVRKTKLGSTCSIGRTAAYRRVKMASNFGGAERRRVQTAERCFSVLYSKFYSPRQGIPGI